MKKDIFIQHGRYEEYVSEFAEAAFRNDRARVDQLLDSEPESCLSDPFVLDALIIIRNEEMFSYLIHRGVRPQYRDYYYSLLLTGETFFRHLPVHPEWSRKAITTCAEEEINHGLLQGRLSPEELKNLLKSGAVVKESHYEDPERTPIILSARYPAIAIVKTLIEAGCNPGFLNNQGKNVFRLILENEELLKTERQEFLRYFAKLSVRPVPELTLFERIRNLF